MSNLMGIVLTGGKQYQFVKGKVYYLERLDAKPGDVISLSNVLMVLDGDKCHVASANKPLNDWEVNIQMQGEVKSDKIRVLKFKKRRNYHRCFGHRQIYSQVLVLDIKKRNKAAAS